MSCRGQTVRASSHNGNVTCRHTVSLREKCIFHSVFEVQNTSQAACTGRSLKPAGNRSIESKLPSFEFPNNPVPNGITHREYPENMGGEFPNEYLTAP